MHQVTLLRPFVSQHVLRIDASPPTVDTLPDSRSVHYDLSPAGDRLYLGGVPRDLYPRLPRQLRSRGGYQGCLASVDLNGECWGVGEGREGVPEEHRGAVREGCTGEGF